MECSVKKVVVLVLLLTALLAAFANITNNFYVEAQSALPIHNWKIAYVTSVTYKFQVNGSVSYLYNKTLWVSNADGTDKQVFISNMSSLGAPEWSPTGDKLAVYSGNTLLVLNGNGQIIQNYTDNTSQVTDYTWTPDGLSILYANQYVGINEINVINGSVRAILKTRGYTLDDCISISPDGTKLAFVHHEFEYRYYLCLLDYNNSKMPYLGDDIYNNRTNPEIRIIKTGRSYWYDKYFLLSWTPDSNRLLFFNDRNESNTSFNQHLVTINTVNIATEETTCFTPNVGNEEILENAHALAFSPDGNKVVFNTYDSVYSIGINGYSLVKITENPYHSESSYFSPDGKLIIIPFGTLEIDPKLGPNELIDGHYLYSSYIINIDGTRQYKVEGPNLYCAWNPVPWTLTNNAPVISTIPSISLTNQQRSSTIYLRNYALDENPPSALNYSIIFPIQDCHLSASIDDNATLHVFTSANYTSTSKIIIQVSDGVLYTNYELPIFVSTGSNTTPQVSTTPTLITSAPTPTVTPTIPEVVYCTITIALILFTVTTIAIILKNQFTIQKRKVLQAHEFSNFRWVLELS